MLSEGGALVGGIILGLHWTHNFSSIVWWAIKLLGLSGPKVFMTTCEYRLWKVVKYSPADMN
jgi:hypothetical protein